MGTLTIVDLIIYILRFAWFVIEPILGCFLCLVFDIIRQLFELEIDTQIAICILLMGTIMMIVSSFDSPANSQSSNGPFELQAYQIHKPVVAYEYSLNSEWKRLQLERTDETLKRRKEIIHFLVSFENETDDSEKIQSDVTRVKSYTEGKSNSKNFSSNEETSKVKIEDIEREIFVVEPLEEDY